MSDHEENPIDAVSHAVEGVAENIHDAAQDVAENVQVGVDNAGQAIEGAAQDVGSAVDDAGAQVEEATNEAGKKVDEAAEKVEDGAQEARDSAAAPDCDSEQICDEDNAQIIAQIDEHIGSLREALTAKLRDRKTEVGSKRHGCCEKAAKVDEASRVTSDLMAQITSVRDSAEKLLSALSIQ